MSAPKLKPCPFCGKQPKFYSESRFSGGERYFIVNCVDKKCPIGPMTGWDSEDAVVSAWNRREPDWERKWSELVETTGRRIAESEKGKG